MVRDVNKEKRIQFSKLVLEEKIDLDTIVFTDECTVQLEAYRRKSYRKQGEDKLIILRSVAKHPVKFV
uniref:Transposase n=1 Tax=Romanomermis culicivorax TaxID=13658 RepID=A0A915K9J0_ROMCU